MDRQSDDGREKVNVKGSQKFWSLAGLFLVILISAGITIYHGYYKEYLYEDEVLSYTLSNSRNGGYFELEPGKWYEGDELYAYTFVRKGEGFDWKNTIRNQQMDTHPPVYALLLHAVCSLDPGHFSKWTGIGLNIVCYIVVIVLLYLTVLELFPERSFFALFVCLTFGMTAGVISLVVFIRMYILLMIITMLCLLWHLKALEKEPSLVSYLLLCILTFAGVMTHYFYLIFAFFCAAFLCVFRLCKKSIRSVLFYIGTMAAAAALTLITWNKVIWQMFSEETAEDALSQKLTAGVVLSKILKMTRQVNEEIFGNRLKYLLIIVLVFFVYLLIKDREKLKRAFVVSPRIVLTVVVTVGFYLTVSAITPYLTTRYISPAYPLFILLALLTLQQVTKEVFRSPQLGLVVVLLFFALPELTLLRNGLFDENRRIISDRSTEYENDICVFGAGISPEENVFELRKFDRIYVYNGKNAKGASKEIQDADRILVYIPDGADEEEYVQDIRDVNPELKNMERLYVAYYSKCYLLSK